MQQALTNFKGWYFQQPLVTRTYLAICVSMTVLVSLGVLAPKLLFYTFSSTVFEFNIWRPFTALFFMGKFDFGFIFNAYFAYIALSKVETLVFPRERYADFLYLNVVLFLSCVVVGSIINLFFFSNTYLMAMIYIWCKNFPHEEITIMFGFRVKTGYFPFVYAIMMTLFGGSFIPNLIGIILGHAYVFVKDIATVRYHKDYLQTPLWFKNWWYGRSEQEGVRRNVGAFQGQGVRLG